MTAFARALLVSFVLAVFTDVVRAQEENTSFDVMVRVIDEEDHVLLDRVRGQTADLDVLLFTDSLTTLEPTLSAQLATARKLAQQTHVRVVVWFVRDEGALTVYVAEPSAGRILVRSLEPQEGRLGGSAQQEAAGLVVRSALRALSAGGEIGVVDSDVVKPSEPPPEPKQASAPVIPKKPSPQGFELTQHLGARAAWDGASKYGQHGLVGRLVLRHGGYQVEARGAVSFPSHLDDDVARVTLHRHGASVHAAWVPRATERFVVSLAGGAGVNVFITDVDARTRELDARDDLSFLPVFSFDAALRFMPAWAKGRAGIGCLIGADVLPLAPTVGYRDLEGHFVARDRILPVLPSVQLELLMRVY